MEKKQFIYITPFVEEAFFTVVKKAMTDAAAMLGVEVEFTGTVDADTKKLSRIIEKAADDGCDGIAVSMVDEAALTPAVEKVRQKGIPVVAFNIGAKSPGKVLASVSQDAYRAGQVVGRRIQERRKKTGRILFTLHDDVEVLQLRLKGIQDVLGAEDAKVIVSGNTPELAAEAIQRELELDGNIDTVIGTGQSDTQGAGIVARRLAEKREIYAAGFDVCQEILLMVKEGSIDFTIDQQPYVQGFYPLLMLYQNAMFGIMPSDINAGNAVIDRENIDQILEAAKKGVR